MRDPDRATPTPVTPIEIHAYAEIAAFVGQLAAHAAVRACGGTDPVCLGEKVRGWGRRLLRRPLDDRDMRAVEKLCQAERQRSGDVEGIALAAAFLMQVPQFLYVTERGKPQHDDSGLRALGSMELASRMALALWQGPPDDELLMAAESGALETDEGRAAQVERMLDDARARSMLAEQIARHFVPELIGPTPPDVPGLEVETRAMLEQLRTFSMRVYARGGSLATFLGYPRSPVDSTLAHLYGIDARAMSHALRWYETPDRHGLLTLPAFLVAKAGPTHASIVRRGLFVSERLLCRSVPPQPAGVAVSIPAPLEAETLRQRHARHSTDRSCASCHRRIDPLGFAFEHYDHRGRHRREDHGAAIDASGTVLADGEVHAFDDLSGLVSVLSQSEAVRRCWTWTWVRILLPGEPPATVGGLVEAVVAGTTSETPLRDILATIVTSDRFRRLARLDAPPDTEAPPWADAPSTDPTGVPLAVRSLVDLRCAPCHFEGGDAHEVADFSTDDDLAAHASQAVALVRTEAMPPDDPLSPSEHEVLLRWLVSTSGATRAAPSETDDARAP